MSTKTAMNIAIVVGFIACGLAFAKISSSGNIFIGLLGGLVFGTSFWLMSLGALHTFVNKEGSSLTSDLDPQDPKNESKLPNRESVTTTSFSQEEDVGLMFSDGARITSQQLGYFSFKWSGEWADSIIEEFAPGKIASAFPASEAITESPFLARLYLTLFHATIYLAYVTTILRAPDHCIHFFFSGITYALSQVKHPNGAYLTDKEIQKLLKSAARFAHAIEIDVTTSMEDSVFFNPNNTNSGTLLIEDLLRIYPSAAPDSRSILPMYGISRLIDQTPFSLMEIIKDNLGLKLE